MSLLKSIKRNLINVRGVRTDRKLLVIESDDWGSIRMPSKDVLERLRADGCNPESDPYLAYDSLESNADMEGILDVLSNVKDSRGRHAVLTANAVVANPDFERIRQSDFQEYHYEPFTSTLKRYPFSDNVLQLWKKGIQMGVFIPQFHGREHLHVGQWMNDLRENLPLLKKAFDLEMLSISSVPGRLRFSYMEGMDHFSEQERLAKKDILESGHRLFTEIVGYPSKSFIANCYIWDHTVEEVLKGQGIKLMQGILNQIQPIGNGKHILVKHFMGQKSKQGMTYSIRNVFFEPTLQSGLDWIDEAMARINIAFLWKKPAIIGSHRLNYIGSINENNRSKNLKLLSTLLQRVAKQWPDIEFISSADLADEIS